MRTIKRKRNVLLTAFMMLCGAFDGMTAQPFEMEENIELPDTATDDEFKAGDHLYFGNYQQSGNGSGGFNTEPIRWRVLKVNGGKLMLISEQNLDVRPYHTDSEPVTWETSALREWLNSGFIDSAFSSKERAAIGTTKIANPNNPTYGAPGGNATNDQLFLLSYDEAKGLFTGDRGRTATNTAFVASHPGLATADTGDWWWLRSPGSFAIGASLVFVNGSLDNIGYLTYYTIIAVRPAFSLDRSSILFTSAAMNGKSGGIGANLSAAVAQTGDKKLTLTDAGQTLSTAATIDKYVPGTKTAVTITYTGAKTGANQTLSAMITHKDDGSLLYYGAVKALNVGDAAGMATVTIPDNFDSSIMTLKIFTEQQNGDGKTDFASQPITVNVSSNVLAPVTADAVKREVDLSTIHIQGEALSAFIKQSDQPGAASGDSNNARAQ